MLPFLGKGEEFRRKICPSLVQITRPDASRVSGGRALSLAMAASPSLTLDELRALLALLEGQDMLSPALQAAGSKLQIQALDFLQGPEHVQTGQSLQGTSPPLTIRIPARRPRSLSSDRNETRQGDDHLLPDTLPVSRPAPSRRRRTTASGTSTCKRGAARPLTRKERSSKKGVFYRVSDEDDIDVEDREVFAAQDPQLEEEPNLTGDRTLQSLALLASCTPLPETQVLPPALKMLLLTVENACDSILASKEENRATLLMDAFEGHNTFVGKVSYVTAEDSLESLAIRCSTADQNVALSDFLYMLCTIHLRVRIMQ